MTFSSLKVYHLHVLDIINFDSSDEHFALLVSLQDVLWPYPWKNWESVKMCRYDAALIPPKCKAQLDFIRYDGRVIGWGATHHDQWGFDPNLLDSTLTIPQEDKYLDCAQQYLEYQIKRARKMKVKIFRAWSDVGSDWYKNFYTNNGFEVSLLEYISEINLDKFFIGDFKSSVSRFKKSEYVISNLKELRTLDADWETKMFDLWKRIEHDVPSDISLDIEFDLWKSSIFCPWFKEEDVYIVLDGDRWVALSTYTRSLRSSVKISTALTGVLPEHRRQGLCIALKIHALSDLKKKGFKKVFTGNEENNPMFQINLMLGFKKIREEFGCKLVL
mgnify:CR=1 FL=1